MSVVGRSQWRRCVFGAQTMLRGRILEESYGRDCGMSLDMLNGVMRGKRSVLVLKVSETVYGVSPMPSSFVSVPV